MAFTITTKPHYSNYHADSFYLKGLKLNLSDILFLNNEDKNISIPLIKLFINKDFFDLYSPIGFQASLGVDFWKKNIEGIINKLNSINALSFYTIVKDDIHIEDMKINTNDYRINYKFNLNNSIENLMNNQKRDCKQRLKKAINSICYKVNLSTDLTNFTKQYKKLSDKNNFSLSYRFDIDNFKAMLKSEDVVYLELIDNYNNFLSGGFFGICNQEVDYLFGATSEIANDTIRLLIWEAIKKFKKDGLKSLFLGGGIQENDSLSVFKKRFGTEEVKCSLIKVIVNKKQVERIMNEKINKNWFDGFFPFYRAK